MFIDPKFNVLNFKAARETIKQQVIRMVSNKNYGFYFNRIKNEILMTSHNLSEKCNKMDT